MKKIWIVAIITGLLLTGHFLQGTPKELLQRIQSVDLEYLGAIRLPDGESGSDVKNWLWSGEGLTYYPLGDPGGADDGFPGSLFGTGHNWAQEVSEISIPVPVISVSKNPEQLNTAVTLQGFHDIMGVGNLEIPRTDIQYLPAQGSQGSGKLYFCRGAHYQDVGDLTHGWCSLNLSNPQVAGYWRLVGRSEYSTNDYLFDIPSAWAAAYTPGMRLAGGRFRDGGWSGQGPSIFAFGPWNQGNPPAPGTPLQNTALLLYTSTEDYSGANYTMNNYHHSDEWSGGAWLTAGAKSAVVFVGTKGTGNCWYGFANGVVWPEGPPYPPIPEPPNDQRGWWSTGFKGQMIFYDTADLAAVAQGTMNPWEPQPYASLDIDDYLYHISSTQQWHHTGAVAFDRDRGYLYVLEPLADNDKSLVHVWKIKSSGTVAQAQISLSRTLLAFGALAGQPVSRTQNFRIGNSGQGTMEWTAGVNSSVPWLSIDPISGTDAGVVTVTVDAANLTTGQYQAAINVSSPNAANSPQTVSVTLSVMANGSSAPPFGVLATPQDGAEVQGSIPVTGWVLDDIGVESIKIYRQENGALIYIGDGVRVEGARPDVQQAYPHYPDNDRAGWGYMMLTNFLPGQGNGTYQISAQAIDVEGHETVLGTVTITGKNAEAVKPFGAIDTPTQGGIASGNSYINWGWVLTPSPNHIPSSGATISVYVDGIKLGHPVYNIFRSDIAALFPGYANSNGAVGYFILDTTTFSNGVHTIQWIAVDSAGNQDGIGSRFFTIQNSGSDEVRTKNTIDHESNF